MDDQHRVERIDGIRRQLETRDTEDLLEIWQKNDRDEWTPEAFDAIQGILTARNVSLPQQETDDLPEEADTYHDSQRLVRISSVARGISWLAIVLLGLSVILSVFYFLQSLSTGGSLAFALATGLIVLLGPILFFGFIWVVLQVVAEGIYLFMDIEENTRK